MDGGVTGLVAGGASAILIVVVGAAALFSNFYQKAVEPYNLYIWLLIVTILTVSQTILTGFLVWTLMAAPTQEAVQAPPQK